jgi:hypothetical protein
MFGDTVHEIFLWAAQVRVPDSQTGGQDGRLIGAMLPPTDLKRHYQIEAGAARMSYTVFRPGRA